MTAQEYNKTKNYSYEEFIDYLISIHGPVKEKYTIERSNKNDNGLFIHHIKENIIANLSNQKGIHDYPEYQTPDNLVYCDFLEHLFAHILIGEQTDSRKALGLGGAINYIIPLLDLYYENNIKKYNDCYYERIKNDYNLFKILKERAYKITLQTKINLNFNDTLYEQAEYYLDNHNKALVVLGTGLGKTTTALQYLWTHHCRALVIGPNNLIKSGWEEYSDWVDTTTYQSFSNNYTTIEYDKYGLVIIDEAHHAGYDEETETGAKVWYQGIKHLLDTNVKILGLTATPERTDGIDIDKTIFKGCVAKGYSVEDGIEQGIIHPFSYVTALYDTDELLKNIKEEYDCDDQVIKKYIGQLDLEINNTPTVKQIFHKHMPTDVKRKGIIFISEIKDKEYVMDIFKDIYPNIEYRTIDSKMPEEEVSKNRKWFENTNEGYLIAINMISEGAHYKGVNTIIMFRRTSSYLVYTQQLGRIITLSKNENPNAIVFDLVNNADTVDYINRKIKKAKTPKAIIEALEKLSKEKNSQIIVADETRDIVKVIKKIKEYESNSWQDWEYDILIKYYEKEGPVSCMKRINKHWEEINNGIN